MTIHAIDPGTVRAPIWTIGGELYDFAAPSLYADLDYLDLWREARRRHPIAWFESPRAGGFWAVMTHGLAKQVLGQPARFTSSLGMRLGGDEGAVKAASGKMLVVSDGPNHRRLRAAHSVCFKSDALADALQGLPSMIDNRLRELIDQAEVFDAVQELAIKIPAWSLLRMLGVPEADWDELVQLTINAFDDTDELATAEAEHRASHAQLFAYFIGLLRERRRRPGHDAVTLLAHATVGDSALSDEEIILNCDGLMNGGLETTPLAISAALLAFAEHPEAWQQLRSGHAAVETAIEEILRWSSPAMHAMRTATADAELAEVKVREGERVVVWLPSCNRDDDVFPEADSFRIDRRPNPHLCLGSGPHYCIGATLARIELRHFLDVLTTRVARIEVGGKVIRKQSNFLRGLDRLDVRMISP